MILIQMTMTRECHLPRARRLNVLPLRCEPSPATETDFPSNDEKVTLSWDLRCPLTSIWQWRPRKGDCQRGRRSLEGGLVRLTSATVGFLIIILIIITIMIIIFAMMMMIIIMASPHVGLGRLASATVFSSHVITNQSYQNHDDDKMIILIWGIQPILLSFHIVGLRIQIFHFFSTFVFQIWQLSVLGKICWKQPISPASHSHITIRRRIIQTHIWTPEPHHHHHQPLSYNI